MSEILYIPEFARLTGRTEAAVRGLIQRDSTEIPPFFRVGGRIAWRRRTVDEWLYEQERQALDRRRQPGRPRLRA